MNGRRGNTANAGLPALLAVSMLTALIAGCGGTPMKTHEETIGGIMKEYYIPSMPVDQSYIGCPWSKQHGFLRDQCVPDIVTRKERSFNSMQQDFAYNLGIGFGGQTLFGVQGGVGVDASGEKRAKLEGVEIIMADSLAEIPFEPKVPYVTEALRLANFRLKKAGGVGVTAGITSGTTGISGTGVFGGGGGGSSGTEGEGLVVAYKLHTIDLKSSHREESGNVALELNKTVDFTKAKVVVKAYLQNIEPGSKRSLPRNLVWSCPRANAMRQDMVAAWIVEVKPTEAGRKSLAIAFPALPKVDDCYVYSGVIYSRIDPVTDKIYRQKINIAVLEAEVSDTLTPIAWVTRMSLVDESFNIKLVGQGDL